MKKMTIRHTLSFIIATLLTISAFAKGGDAPRVEIAQVAAKQVTLTVEGLSSQAEIEVRAEDGVVLMKERFRGQSSIERLLNLEQLPTGSYLIVFATPMQDILQPVEITKEGLILQEGLRKAYYAPAVRVQDRQVDVTLFNSRLADVELTLYSKESEVVFQESIENVVQVQKRLNLIQLPKGLYTLKVATPYKAYYKDIALR